MFFVRLFVLLSVIFMLFLTSCSESFSPTSSDSVSNKEQTIPKIDTINKIDTIKKVSDTYIYIYDSIVYDSLFWNNLLDSSDTIISKIDTVYWLDTINMRFFNIKHYYISINDVHKVYKSQDVINFYYNDYNYIKCDAVQCYGTTKKGVRCKNRTTNCDGYCYLH